MLHPNTPHGGDCQSTMPPCFDTVALFWVLVVTVVVDRGQRAFDSWLLPARALLDYSGLRGFVHVFVPHQSFWTLSSQGACSIALDCGVGGACR